MRSARDVAWRIVVQVLAGVYLLAMFTNLSLRFWSTEGDGRPRSPVYGIWEVVELRLDGQAVAPADADYDRRWRRVIFDTPDVVAIQRTDDSVAHYGAALEAGGTPHAAVEGPQPDVAGRLRGRSAPARRAAARGRDGRPPDRGALARVELDTFRLRQSPFRWVRPPDPFAG